MDQERQNDGFKPFQREMVKGNWPCSKCGNAITELPFQPDPARMSQLQCRDCYKANKKPFTRNR